MSLSSQQIWTWRRINGLLPELRPLAWALIGYLIYKHGIYTTVTQGYRTIQAQDELYEQGRTKPGRIVTYARGGQSKHNKRKAFDIAFLEKDGSVVWEGPWETVGAVGEALGLNWGGRWLRRDRPHFEQREFPKDEPSNN